MRKPVAHAILALFDLAAIGAVYYAISQRDFVLTQMQSQAATIEYQSLLGFYFLLLLVPVIHGIALVETWVPFKQSLKKTLNYGLVGVLALTTIGAVIFSRSIESRLLSSGYHYCHAKSEVFTISAYKFYVREREQCVGN
jgi:hypothetical protein